jgi:thiol-disulfide isomerase/thioredoxin
LSLGKSAGVEFGTLGLVIGVLIGIFLATERSMHAAHSFKYETQALIGKPAPDLILKKIGGDSITLKQATAQGVVVLDFWATWCPPCRAALPLVSNAVNKFKDKGVTLYAVGGGEDPALETKYLEANHIDATAVTCSDKGFSAYKVTAIPETIVIDKLGIVRAAHVGQSPDEQQEVTLDIENALKASN